MQAIAATSLAEQRIDARQVLVTPTPFNTVLWRVVAMTPEGYHEGFYSLLDASPQIRFDPFDRGRDLHAALANHPPVQRIAWFSHGFHKLSRQGERIFISDLRMGQEPWYSFDFLVALREGDAWSPVSPLNFGARVDLEQGLSWLGRRMLGENLPPPD